MGITLASFPASPLARGEAGKEVSFTLGIDVGTCAELGGAGISKVVRPLQIKDRLCMCTGGRVQSVEREAER